MSLESLKDIKPYIYLGTPYSKYKGGRHLAFEDACRLAAKLVEAGVAVYCPIAHTHGVAEYGGIDPLSHAIWLPADQPFMDTAGALVVGTLDGWNESKGVQFEIDAFKDAGKPIFFLDPATMELEVA